MDRELSFAASGFVSISIYFLVVVLFLFQLHKPHFTTKNRVDDIEVSIDFNEIEPLKKEIVKEKKVEKISQAPKEISLKKKKELTVSKSLSNLFDDLNQSELKKSTVKLTNYANKHYDRKKINYKDSNIKTTDLLNIKSKTFKKENFSLTIKKSDNNKKDITISQISDGIFDKYFSKIHTILAKGWYPIASDEGKIAVILIIIDPDGNFKYIIKRASGDDFIARLKQHLDRIRTISLPKPPKDKRVSIEVNFLAKGY